MDKALLEARSNGLSTAAEAVSRKLGHMYAK
jgi:hypothetical protein